jgi:hypothetical protein
MDQQESKFKFPTELVELPSKGLLYPKDHPLSSGKVELKYMTAKEEDILTNQNYLKDGSVIDKLLQSLIVTKFNYDDLLVGDKNSILVAARILGYGKDYTFNYNNEQVTVDLSELSSNELTPDQILDPGNNSFMFELPHSGNTIHFKLLTGKDEKAIDAEVKGMKRLNKNVSPEMSTRLKYQIIGINGDFETKAVREFIDNHMLARDSSAFRAHYKSINPDIRMVFVYEGSNGEEEVTIPMEASFLWPDVKL